MSIYDKPVAWAPSAALNRLANGYNNAPCVLTDGKAEFNDVPLYREQAETIAALTHGLGTIAAELDIEAAGDGTDGTLVDRVLGAIREMQQDAARYRFLRGQIGYAGHGPYMPCGIVTARRRQEMAVETDAAIDKALAAGEAGNGN